MSSFPFPQSLPWNSESIGKVRNLDRDEINEMLTRRGIGVLAMVDEGQPYAIPMSFGYDAEEMMFPMQWGGGYQSRKNQAIDTNTNVCLTVYEQDNDEELVWRSAIITGELYEIPDDEMERAYASIAANAEFPSDTGVWGIPFEDVEFRMFGLSTKNCTGREFAAKYEGWD